MSAKPFHFVFFPPNEASTNLQHLSSKLYIVSYHIFVYAVKVASIIDYIPLMGFNILQTWTLGSGWSILNGSLFATTVTGVVEWTGSAVVSNRYYYVTIKVGS